MGTCSQNCFGQSVNKDITKDESAPLEEELEVVNL